MIWRTISLDLANLSGMEGLASSAFGGVFTMAIATSDFTAFIEALAKQGDALAQFNLALLYHSGAGGVPADEQKAVGWYRKAADNGYYYAQEYLAVGYQEGWFGLPKDPKQAAYWLKRLDANQY